MRTSFTTAPKRQRATPTKARRRQSMRRGTRRTGTPSTRTVSTPLILWRRAPRSLRKRWTPRSPASADQHSVGPPERTGAVGQRTDRWQLVELYRWRRRLDAQIYLCFFHFFAPLTGFDNG